MGDLPNVLDALRDGMLELLDEDLQTDDPDLADARSLLERARAQSRRLALRSAHSVRCRGHGFCAAAQGHVIAGRACAAPKSAPLRAPPNEP